MSSMTEEEVSFKASMDLYLSRSLFPDIVTTRSKRKARRIARSKFQHGFQQRLSIPRDQSYGGDDVDSSTQSLQPTQHSQVASALDQPTQKYESMTEAIQPSSFFPFLSLPGELRNIIYTFIFVVEPAATKCSEKKKAQDQHEDTIHFLDILRPPPLARVNRQLRTESLLFFFAHTEINVVAWNITEDSGNAKYSIEMTAATRKWLEAEIGFTAPVMSKVRLFYDEESKLKGKELVIESTSSGEAQVHFKHGSECVWCSKDVIDDERLTIPDALFKSHPVLVQKYRNFLAKFTKCHKAWMMLLATISCGLMLHPATRQAYQSEQNISEDMSISCKRGGISFADLDFFVEMTNKGPLEELLLEEVGLLGSMERFLFNEAEKLRLLHLSELANPSISTA